MLNVELKSFLRLVFNKIVLSVKPKELIHSELKVCNDTLYIRNKQFSINRNCYVAGFGKAVYEMCCEVEDILKNNITKGILSVPFDSVSSSFSPLENNRKYKVFQGAKNNIPDYSSYQATQEIVDLVKTLKQEDLLLILISGGGSALLTYPLANLPLEEKVKVIKLLAHSGADIRELNTVRKQLSAVKGGKLARMAYPSQVISLILSDVINDPLDVIASGPTVQNMDQPGSGLAILKKYSLVDKVSQKVVKILNDYSNDNCSSSFDRCEAFVIGNNAKALNAGKTFVQETQRVCVIMTSCLEGQVNIISEALAKLTICISQFQQGGISIDGFKLSTSYIKKVLHISDEAMETLCTHLSAAITEIVLLFGGETTVTVKGQGKGGRNMELALRFSENIDSICTNTGYFKNTTVGFLSAGTDGIDGPTDSAGAISYPGQAAAAKLQGLDIASFISNNDSYNFFKQFNDGEDLIITGHTGTNVMDAMILYIKRIEL